MSVVSRDSGRHYVWGAGCDGWHLLEGDDLSVIEERVPPGAAEMPHRHRHARQFFYVLSGTATLELEGVAHRLESGEGLHVDLRFLVISAPRSHGDREELSA